MLIRRVASAIAGIPLLLGAAYLGSWPLALATGLIGGIATEEARHLLGGRCAVPRWLLLAWPAVAAFVAVVQPDAPAGFVLLPGVLAVFIRQAMRAMTASDASGFPVLLQDGLNAVFLLIYPGFLLSFLAGLRTAYDYETVWLIMGMVWAADTLAYFGGMVLRGRRLAPALSPGKTVAGALTGLAGAALVGMGFGPWVGMSMAAAAGLGLVVGGAGQCGDLFESLLKRLAGVKDSGSLIPGHGGFLDRFDSMAFALPVAYLYLVLAGL